MSRCATCPWWLKKLDGCPLTPEVESFDLLMVLISLWAYAQGAVLFYNFLRQRSLRTFAPWLAYFIGKVLCDASKIFVFREARPDGACSTSFGLPSCHSLLAGQHVAWLLFEIYYFGAKLDIFKIFQIVVMVLVPFTRVYLIYHSVKQVIYGWSFGTFIAWVGVVATSKVSPKVKDI